MYMDAIESVEELVSKGSAAFERKPFAVSAPPADFGKKTVKPAATSEPPTLERGPGKKPFGSTAPSRSLKEKNKDHFEINDVEAVWSRVIETIKTKRMSLSLYLAEADPIEVENGTIVLGFSPEFKFHKETVEKDGNRKLVEEVFQEVLGEKARIQCVITQKDEISQELPAPKPAGADSPDILAQALEIFDGARIIRKE